MMKHYFTCTPWSVFNVLHDSTHAYPLSTTDYVITCIIAHYGIVTSHRAPLYCVIIS